MSYSIAQYIANHSIYFRQYEEVEEDVIAFDFSFLDLQFIGRDVEQTMLELLEKLREPTKYQEKNGTRKNEKGEVVQKWTTRQIDLSQLVQAEAIHTFDIDGVETMPHIHFLITKNARLGKNFSLLKKHIDVISKEMQLRPHFSELSKGQINLGKAVKKFTWNVAKTTRKNFISMAEDGRLKKGLDLLLEYVEKTQNLTYFVKTLDRVQEKLKKEKIDFSWYGFNLKEIYPLPLNLEDKKVIDIIKRNPTKKEIEKYHDHAIMRDYIRFSNGGKSYIINSMRRQLENFKNLRPSQKAVKLYDDIQKQYWLDNEFELQKFYSYLIEASLKCNNEKELKEALKKKGYTGLGFAKSNGKKTGFYFYENKIKQYIYLKDLNITWKKITAMLMSQEQQIATTKKPKSTYQNQLFFDYYKKHLKTDLSGFYITQNENKEVEISSKVRDIKIVDRGSKITNTTQKGKKDYEKDVEIMLEMALAKGWRLTNLVSTGNQEFQKEFQRQKKAMMRLNVTGRYHKYKNPILEREKRKESVQKSQNKDREIRELEREIEKFERETREYSTTLDDRVEDRRDTNEGLRSELDEFEGELNDRRYENRELGRRVTDRRDENGDLEREIDELERAVEAKKQRRKEQDRVYRTPKNEKPSNFFKP